jgi:hypothetical protein
MVERGRNGPSGGRGWWAHCDFTRINIAPTILHKKFEDLRVLGALPSKRLLSVSRSGRVSPDGAHVPTILRKEVEDGN